MEEPGVEVTGVEETTEVDPSILDATALDAALIDPDEDLTDDAGGEPEEQEKVQVPVEENQSPEETAEEKQAKLDKQLKAKEEFIKQRQAEIDRLSARIGELRKLNQEAPTEESYYENPADTVNQVLATREREAEIARLGYQAQVHQNEVAIKTLVPEIDELIDPIAELAAKDGATPELIRNFKANPFAEAPALVIQLARRVQVEKENAALKAEIETLRKKPDEVVKRIEEAAKGHKPLTAASGKGGKPTGAEKQAHLMSDAELDSLLQE